jgi:feruloyl esterase
MTPRLFSALSLCISILAVCGAHAAASDCSSLEKIPIPNATIHAEVIGGKAFTPPAGKTISDLPQVCRVVMKLVPSSDSAIAVELWLPVNNWNGKLQGVGNGGFAGSISYDGLALAVRLNYAVVATDTGHQGAADDASWALNHPEKIIDFGYRAIHLMTLDAKPLVKAFYRTAAKHAYFNSCSNGGREALMEAQRFPEDYDGILAGAPANYWTHLITNSAANSLAFIATKESYIPASKLPAIQAAAQRACDSNDGVKDNIIENPLRCHFDTAVILCKGAETDACLNPDQLAAVNKLYGGGHLSDGKPFFPGYAPGGEAAKGNWDAWITGPAVGRGFMFAYGTQFFKNMVYNNPDWDLRTFDPDRDLKAADKLAPILNSTNPDLSKFTARGGKLILYHGWDDAAIAPLNTIQYFESVERKMGSASTDKAVRLFMVPGMQHCSNGNGAYSFGQFGAGAGDASKDIDAALVRWVENGQAPTEIIASKPGTTMTHPLCAYPASATYKGAGDPSLASSFTCAESK